MPVAHLTLEIDIPHAQSLKDRRQVVRSLKDTLRRGFNVSVAELDEFPVWNRATVGVVALSRSASYLEGQMLQVEQATRRTLNRFGADLLDSTLDLLETDSDGLPSTSPFTASQQVTDVPCPDPATSPATPPNSAIVTSSDIRNA